MTNINEKLSEVPPPPPLPFPPLSFSGPAHKNSSEVNGDKEAESFDAVINRISSLEGLCAKPFYAINTYLESQIQKGPKCGLFALSIATSKTNNFKSADELFVEAIRKGYTTHGEIYNCQHLADLAENASNFKSYVISGGINNHIDCIFHCLQSEGLMLVPYDADFNHSPCRRRGHKAHWAVISGVAVLEARDAEGGAPSERHDSDAIEIDPGTYGCGCDCRGDPFFGSAGGGNPKIVRHEGRAFVVGSGGSRGTRRRGRIFLAGRQGKSRRLAVWPLEKLAESNDNLVELSEQQAPRNFVLPAGGVAEGLKGKAILLKCEAPGPTEVRAVLD